MSQDVLSFTTSAGGVFNLNLTFAGSATTGVPTAISGQDVISGTTYTVGGLLSTSSSFNIDNTISGTAPYVDSNGLGFTVSSGNTTYDVILYYDTSTSSYDIKYKAPGGNTYTTESVTGVTLTQNVCFVEGTRILTARGEVAVEDLQIGDLAWTAGGERRPIKWLGHRRVDCRNHPRAFDARPVRIAAHAFGPNKPHRDLYVSPGHALCVNVVGEVLIRAYSLINGTTIQQIETDSVAYWHVELDTHDVLIAENLPAESYLDMANRNFFVESGVVLIDPIPDATEREGAFCRPLHTDGPVVAAVRAQLLAQAKSLGWTLARDPFNDLHMIADGVRVDPQIEGLTARFAVPAGAVEVELVAKTSLPYHLPEALPDVRPLGVCLKALTLDDGSGARAVALDDERLDHGFHGLEPQSWGALRWMSGRAQLSALVRDAGPNGLIVGVEMLTPALPVWVAPAAYPEAAQAA